MLNFIVKLMLIIAIIEFLYFNSLTFQSSVAIIALSITTEKGHAIIATEDQS
jgi:hypothetical protein